MNHISGMGGYAPSSRWRKTSLSRKGQKALARLRPDEDQEVGLMIHAHRDTENFRSFADRFKDPTEEREVKESVVRFDLDKETGMINLKLFDPDSGHLQVELTPEQVAEGLRTLEETDDNDRSLKSFFIDIKV